MPPTPENASTGQLIGQLTEQVSRLVRDEARLAQAEVTQKAKRLGVGAGLFGGAGLFALLRPGRAGRHRGARRWRYVLPAWLAALVVAVVLFAVAGVLALVGKKDVAQGVAARADARPSPASRPTSTTVKQAVVAVTAGRTTPNDPDAIKAEIEATREQLAATVDELSARLDVPARAKESAARAKDTAVETYRESPPLVIGAAAWPWWDWWSV